MIVHNNPDNYLKREDRLLGNDLSYSEKINIMNVDKRADLNNETIDERGYSKINKDDNTEKTDI